MHKKWVLMALILVAALGVPSADFNITVDGVNEFAHLSYNTPAVINGVNFRVYAFRSSTQNVVLNINDDFSLGLDLGLSWSGNRSGKQIAVSCLSIDYTPQCGDGFCDWETESKATCCMDCGCDYGKVCFNNVCEYTSRISVSAGYDLQYTVHCPGFSEGRSGSYIFGVPSGQCSIQILGVVVWSGYVNPGGIEYVQLSMPKCSIGDPIFGAQNYEFYAQKNLVVPVQYESVFGSAIISVSIDGAQVGSETITSMSGQVSVSTLFTCTDTRIHRITARINGQFQCEAYLDCNRAPYALLNKYSWSGFQEDDIDAAINELTCVPTRCYMEKNESICVTSRCFIKTEGFSRRPDIRYSVDGGGFQSPMTFGANEIDVFESNNYVTIVATDGTKTARTYYSTHTGDLDLGEIGFLVNGELVSELQIPLPLSNMLCISGIPIGAYYGEATIFNKTFSYPRSANTPLAEIHDGNLGNLLCGNFELTRFGAGTYKAVFYVWTPYGGNKGSYFTTVINIFFPEIHVFEGGCTFCDVNFTNFPEELRVITHKPTDLDYVQKMIEYQVAVGPALVVPGKGKALAMEKLHAKSPWVFRNTFQTAQGGNLIFLPDIRSIQTDKLIGDREVKSYNKTPSERVLTYNIPGTPAKLGVLALKDNLPQAVDVKASNGTVTPRSMEALGPFCGMLKKMCEMQKCNMSCNMYVVEGAEGQVHISVSGPVSAEIDTQVKEVILPSLNVEIQAPDKLLVGRKGTVTVIVRDENNKLVDGAVVLEKEGITVLPQKLFGGTYTISIGPGRLKILVSKMGYNDAFYEKYIEPTSPIDIQASDAAAEAGRAARLPIILLNNGTTKFYGLQIRIENRDLGLKTTSVVPFNLGPGVEKREELGILIPYNTRPGKYEVNITVGEGESASTKKVYVTITSKDILLNLLRWLGLI